LNRVKVKVWMDAGNRMMYVHGSVEKLWSLSWRYNLIGKTVRHQVYDKVSYSLNLKLTCISILIATLLIFVPQPRSQRVSFHN
jgi:hypothetical protein